MVHKSGSVRGTGRKPPCLLDRNPGKLDSKIVNPNGVVLKR